MHTIENILNEYSKRNINLFFIIVLYLMKKYLSKRIY